MKESKFWFLLMFWFAFTKKFTLEASNLKWLARTFLSIFFFTSFGPWFRNSSGSSLLPCFGLARFRVLPKKLWILVEFWKNLVDWFIDSFRSKFEVLTKATMLIRWTPLQLMKRRLLPIRIRKKQLTFSKILLVLCVCFLMSINFEVQRFTVEDPVG